MSSIIQAIREYVPDKRVLDDRPDFSNELAQPLFHKGNSVGCITLHGIGGTPANIRVVADALIAGGYTVISPMLPGHGETVRALNASTGSQWLSCVEAAYDRLREEGCTKILVFGLSLGGVLAGLLAASRPTDGLMMICAPLRMKPFLRAARLISPLLPFVRYPDDGDDKDSWRKNPYAQMYDGFSTVKLRDLDRLARRLCRSLDHITCPTLSVNARFDDKVDTKSIDILRRGAVNAASLSFVMLEDSPHGCTYGPERARVAALAADFAARAIDKAPAATV